MPLRARRLDAAAEIRQRAELGMDRLVAALGRADRPRAARIARPRVERVVAALALGGADRVDRRQVEDVEAHRRDVGQARLDVGERAVRAPAVGASAGTSRTTRRSRRGGSTTIGSIGSSVVASGGPRSASRAASELVVERRDARGSTVGPARELRRPCRAALRASDPRARRAAASTRSAPTAAATRDVVASVQRAKLVPPGRGRRRSRRRCVLVARRPRRPRTPRASGRCRAASSRSSVHSLVSARRCSTTHASTS